MQKVSCDKNVRLRGSPPAPLIGYMRVSKADGSQVLDLQRDALLAAGVKERHLYSDAASGNIGGRDIVVSNPDAGFSITYRKDGAAPMLVAINGIEGSSEPSRVKFWAQAWKAAHRKAVAVGWLRS